MPSDLRLLSVLLLFPTAAGAQSTCSASQQFRLSWASQTQGTQGVAARTYTATDGGARTETVTFSYTGATAALGDGPAVSTQEQGGQGANTTSLRVRTSFSNYATDIDSESDVVIVRIQFARMLRELQFNLFDIDMDTNFRDWIKVQGADSSGNVITPRIESPSGRNNQTNPGGSTNFYTVIGATTFNGRAITAQEVVGDVANAASSRNEGNLLVSFSRPVDRIELRYANGLRAFGATNTAPGNHAIAFHDLTFCTMPAVALAKTSASVSATGAERFAIPGADLDYTLTLTNSGGSAVDVDSTSIADRLPAGVAFFNGDLDPTTPGVQAVVLTGADSGLSLASDGIGYSNNGGTTYSYTPAAGYDPAISAIQFRPSGQLAAYSSATIRFRVRVR